MVYMVWITTSKDNIINIKNKDGEGIAHFLGVDSVVIMTPRKSIILEKSIHFGIPSPRSLFETIERLPKVTNKVVVFLDKAKGLFHVDLFMQISM